MAVVEIDYMRSFIRSGDPSRFVAPFLDTRCDLFDVLDPVTHEVEAVDGGFEHRIVWRCNTGATIGTDSEFITQGLLRKIYEKVRSNAEEFEFYACGAIYH